MRRNERDLNSDKQKQKTKEKGREKKDKTFGHRKEQRMLSERPVLQKGTLNVG